MTLLVMNPHLYEDKLVIVNAVHLISKKKYYIVFLFNKYIKCMAGSVLKVKN